MNLKENSGCNILAYINYLCTVMTDSKINDLLNLFEEDKKNEIMGFWNILSVYEEINQLFEIEIFNAIKNDYFEYSLISLSISQNNNRKRFLETMKNCPNLENKFLFHGTSIEKISKIIISFFRYPNRPMFGKGKNFTDMLDYASFYGNDLGRHNFGSTIPVNQTFSCVSAEVYYDKNKKIDIYNYNFSDQNVQKNGIHLAKVIPDEGSVRNKEEIIKDMREGKFLANEYVITKFDQILPLYGLVFKRNEYCIIWRDSHFSESNEFYGFLEEKKVFIYQYAKMNAYFESSIEKALEIIQRKKFNKIILISNIGKDLSGKKFVEIARKILGFDVLVLFYSKNRNHFSWLKNFPNALFTDNDNFYHEYILNYNENGLLNLKKKVEAYYNIELIFHSDFLQFPKFINQKKYKDIIFNEPSPNYKKVLIKNYTNNLILCMDNNGKIFFNSAINLDDNINSCYWYITLTGNEITLFSNGYYIGINDTLKEVISQKNMTIFNYEIINDSENYIYYNNKDKTLTLDGDKLTIHNFIKTNQKFKFVEKIESKFAEFYINEKDNNLLDLNGILRLILMKCISDLIKDVDQIDSIEIKKIISKLKKSIKLKKSQQNGINLNLEEKSGLNILAYSHYINSIDTDKELEDCLNYIDLNKKFKIFDHWNILSKYKTFNRFFEVDISKAVERSYFDYSLIGLSVHEPRNKENFIEAMNKCPNLIFKFLFHNANINDISKIMNQNHFDYPKKALYGMGIYFTDMLDYIAFSALGGESLEYNCPIDETFSCVSAEIYYSQNKKRDVFDYSLKINELDHSPTYEEIKQNYSEKMVEKGGVHFIRHVPMKENIDKKINYIKEGKFIACDYVITEKDQILPLYGLTFKRNEYLIVWRDPHFENDEFLKEKKLFIYEYSKMNAYFVGSIERALVIIKRKRFNKIILISNIGLDLSGKKLVEIARQILGFNVTVLFYSKNRTHLSWLQSFPNALFTDNENHYHDYILNYNSSGLIDLKKKIELYYNIKLNFEYDFLYFPKFINHKKIDEIIFREPTSNFKKTTIKNNKNDSILCMENNGEIRFKSRENLDIQWYLWYITIFGNEITLFSNGHYLGADIESKKVISEKYMKIYFFEKTNNNQYILYYNNKNNVLTINGSNALFQNLIPGSGYQKFRLVDILDEI